MNTRLGTAAIWALGIVIAWELAGLAAWPMPEPARTWAFFIACCVFGMTAGTLLGAIAETVMARVGHAGTASSQASNAMNDNLHGTAEDWDELPVLIGCTCDHDPDEHGWGSCEAKGCNCEGGWEE